MKKFIKNTMLVICSLLSLIMLVSGGGPSGKKNSGSNVPCGTTEIQTDLVLYQNFNNPPNRLLNVQPAPAFPSPWTGHPSATGIYDSPYTKYYCLITITNLDCTTYGNAGVKSYVWESQTRNGSMKLMIPKSERFRIIVEYYEPCGAYWSGSNSFGRGRWVADVTVYSPSAITAITQFYYTGKENC